MAQPRTKGVIVANRSRPIPHQESHSCPIPQPQESLSRSIPEESLVEATQSIVSIPVGGEFLPSLSPMSQVLPEETGQPHPSNSQEGCSDIVTKTIKSIGNEWKTFRGEGCFIATRRGVLFDCYSKTKWRYYCTERQYSQAMCGRDDYQRIPNDDGDGIY